MSYKYLCYLLIAIMLFSACKHDEKKKPQPALTGNWYKRYKGTIGKDTIVLNLFYATIADSSEGLPYSGGTYYYVGKSTVYNLSLHGDAGRKDIIHIAEDVCASDGGDTTTQYNTFTLAIDGSAAVGRFHKAYSKGLDSVVLEENYDNAYPLRIMSGEESLDAKGKGWEGKATGVCVGIQTLATMDTATAGFIFRSTTKGFSGNYDTLTNMADFIKIDIQEYLQEFKKDAGRFSKDTTITDICMNRYVLQTLFPVYNDRGMLVIQRAWYDYACGAHGMYGYSYVVMDVNKKKVLQLADVLQVDTATINRLLNTEARDTYIHSYNYSKIFSADFPTDIKMVADFYIDDKGITFTYPPGQLMGFVLGEIRLSIPYTSLKPLLKPEFVARMGLRL